MTLGGSVLETVEAVRFVKVMSSGKSRPLLLGCTASSTDGEIEVVAKFTAGLERETSGLAIEAVVSMLACDLGLRVTAPYIVEITDDFIQSIPNGDAQTAVRNSVRPTFGCALASPGFSVFSSDDTLPAELIDKAGEIFLFDSMVLNSDRRPTNPNCLFDGTTLVIIDHELCLTLGAVGSFLQPYPWQAGALGVPGATSPKHLLYDSLFRKSIDFGRIEAAWSQITDDRLQQYSDALPERWRGADQVVSEALEYLKLARDNVSLSIAEVKRVLT